MGRPKKKTWAELLEARGDPHEIYGELLAGAWDEVLRDLMPDAEQMTNDQAFFDYADYPIPFIRDVLGHRLWKAQATAANKLMEKKRIVIRSCRKAGKTFDAADIVTFFMSTGESIVITTAPTHNQVRNLLWGAIGAAVAGARFKLPGRLNTQDWRCAPQWYAQGVSVDRPENILGFHAGVDVPTGADRYIDEADFGLEATKSGLIVPRGANSSRAYGLPGLDDEDTPPLDTAPGPIEPVITPPGPSPEVVIEEATKAMRDKRARRILFVLDEAPGIDPPIWDAMEGSLMGDNCYVLVQGNPTMDPDADHPYARACRPGSGWWRMHIAAHDFPAEWDGMGSDARYIGVPDWIMPAGWPDERKKDWGEESPLYRSYVLGLFSSPVLESQFIPLRLLYAAQDLDLYNDGTNECRHIGVDVAATEGKSGDWSVAALNIGGALAAEHQWRTADTMHTVGTIIDLARQWGVGGVPIPARNIHVDHTGLGIPICDRLRQLLSADVDKVDFGAAPKYEWRNLTGEMRFLNRKTELHWVVRRALQEQKGSIPRKYADCWRQAQWSTYRSVPQRAGTLIEVKEKKEDLRRRYGRSPDNWDAYMLSWSRTAAPSSPIQFISMGGGRLGGLRL